MLRWLAPFESHLFHPWHRESHRLVPKNARMLDSLCSNTRPDSRVLDGSHSLLGSRTCIAMDDSFFGRACFILWINDIAEAATQSLDLVATSPLFVRSEEHTSELQSLRHLV